MAVPPAFQKGRVHSVLFLCLQKGYSCSMAQIRILGSETYRLIAAGEVIDRPASALRELLDNAIDAGATEIRVEIAKGGVELLRVSDNGCGMSREDLVLSIQEHATSKIEKADDLLTVKTLGFRGEALASIAAVAKLEMLSKAEGPDSGWRLLKEPGLPVQLEATPARRGTTISIRALFERFPARRQFLKRPSSEAAQCRQVFVEKALAHPSIGFVWNSGAESEHLAPSSLKERIALLYREIPSDLLSLFQFEAAGCPFGIVYADPAFSRRDRKYLQVFVNRRRVPEWGLSGSMEYAFSEYLPGGMRPCAFLFAEIDPSLADFNIHPAKREVRIKNAEALRSAVYAAFRAHLRSSLGEGIKHLDWNSPRTSLSSSFPGSETWQKLDGKALDRAFWDRLDSERRSNGEAWAGEAALRESGNDDGPTWEGSAFAARSTQGAGDGRTDPAIYGNEENECPPSGQAFRFLGRAFGPFLVFESAEELYILDQHAAQERILYDKLRSAKGKSQALLVPFIMDIPDSDLENRITSSLPELEHMGYRMEKNEGQLVVSGVPAILGEKGLSILAESLAEDNPPGSGPEEKLKAVTASIACKAAVKDGDLLEDRAATTLIAQALALPLPRCPHGRPIWLKLDRKTLERMIGRSV